MEYMVTVGVGLFITWIAIAIVISLVEYPEIWQMLLIVALSPLWLVYKLLKYLVNGSPAVGRYILGIE